MTDALSWRVESVAKAKPAPSSLKSRPLDHPEWVRLLMGDFLAPARLSAEGSSYRVDYLVTAREVSASSPESVRVAMRQSVADDFERLLGTLRDHRARIARVRDGTSGDFSPTLFLDAYELLMAVTVSDDPAHWLLAEDGLCVVRWGLEGPGSRPLLTWTDDEVLAMRRSLEARAGALPKGGASSPRSKVLEDLSQGRLVTAADASDPRRQPLPPAARTPSPKGRAVPSARAGALQWALAVLTVLLVVALAWKSWRQAKEVSELKTELNKLRQRADSREEASLRELEKKDQELAERVAKDRAEAQAQRNAAQQADRGLLDAVVVVLPGRYDGLLGPVAPESPLGEVVQQLQADRAELRALERATGGDSSLQRLLALTRDRAKMTCVEGELESFIDGIGKVLTGADQETIWGERLPDAGGAKALSEDPWGWYIAQSKGTDGAMSWYLTASPNATPPGVSWAEGYPKKAPWEPVYKDWSAPANQRTPAEVDAYRRLVLIQTILEDKGYADIPGALREFLARDLLESMGKRGFERQSERQEKLKQAFKKPSDSKGSWRLLTEAEAPGLAQVRTRVGTELASVRQALESRHQTARQGCSARAIAVARDGRIRDMVRPEGAPEDFGRWEVRACAPEKPWSEWKRVGIVRDLAPGASVPGADSGTRVFLVAMKPVAATPQGASK